VDAHRREIDEAIARVLDSGWFILGPEVTAFESELAQALGARDAVAVANGTDALALALRALGVSTGDEVITSGVSAAFTGLAVLQAGARPVFVDVDPRTLNLDPERLAPAITPRTKAILPVHLYGHPAEMGPILDLARERGLVVLEDACQAHGALHEGRPVGTLAGERGIGALSFYPTKNLGGLGDGGAVLVNDPVLGARLRQLRNGGQSDRYRHEVPGFNSRLDELQAALLRVGLRHLDAWTERRRALAAFYTRALEGAGVALPLEQPYARAVFHLYVVRHPRRDLEPRPLDRVRG
jgi:dTDP-4-amino-4,6-dideoxygalactose transaminase